MGIRCSFLFMSESVVVKVCAVSMCASRTDCSYVCACVGGGVLLEVPYLSSSPCVL